jgi:hypothetical protein
LGAARDRAELLAGTADTLPLLSVQVQSGTGALLRERATLNSSTNYVRAATAKCAFCPIASALCSCFLDWRGACAVHSRCKVQGSQNQVQLHHYAGMHVAADNL